MWSRLVFGLEPENGRLSFAPVQKLEPPDTHFFAAAIGWLELGNPAEARAEFRNISHGQKNHPEVLEVEWAICAAEKDWVEALAVARRILEIYPANSAGWIHQAYALRRAPGHGLAVAWEALLPAAEKFPEESIIPYNLACYACQLGWPGQAKEWLRRACQAGKKNEIIAMALADTDLTPLWDEIRKL